MNHFISKTEYFNALDMTEIDAALSKTQHFGLKHVQDACVLHQVVTLPPGRVAEIGGGHSRTLPWLYGSGWICWNVEPFEGAGNGPHKGADIPGITQASTYLGDFSALLQDASFDLVYSVSVVEHVATSDLERFFQDMFRILKPGGLAWHAIDVYVTDHEDPVTAARMTAVYEAAMAAGFVPLLQEAMPSAMFRCEYATNPDLVMRQWNRSVPALKPKRAISQSVSLLLGLKKIF